MLCFLSAQAIDSCLLSRKRLSTHQHFFLAWANIIAENVVALSEESL
jgi:hypothetical protein